MKIIHEEIEKYLNNELSEVEKHVFELKMHDNAELAEAVEIQRIEHDAMELLVENDLRAMMKQWKNTENASNIAVNNMPKIRIAQNNTWRNAIAIAASLLGVMTCLWLFQTIGHEKNSITSNPTKSQTDSVKTTIIKQETPPQLENTNTYEKEKGVKNKNIQSLIAEKKLPTTSIKKEQQPSIEIPPLPSAEPSSEPTTQSTLVALAETLYGEGPDFKAIALRTEKTQNTDLNLAYNAYNAKQYNLVLQHLNDVTEQDTTYFQSTLLKAHAYFQKKRYDRALEEFQIILRNKPFSLLENSQYYALLCQVALQKHETSDFKQSLNALTNDPDHSYFEEAKKLKKQLE